MGNKEIESFKKYKSEYFKSLSKLNQDIYVNKKQLTYFKKDDVTTRATQVKSLVPSWLVLAEVFTLIKHDIYIALK